MCKLFAHCLEEGRRELRGLALPQGKRPDLTLQNQTTKYGYMMPFHSDKYF